MKHRATIDLEFTNGDLFEQEVIKAMRAYAKTIAREAFQNEVEECVADTAKVWARRLYESRYADVAQGDAGFDSGNRTGGGG